MANTTSSARAICPYFLRSNVLKNGRAVIICEGYVSQTENSVTFRNKRVMECWMATTCESYRYVECQLAHALNIKYQCGETVTITSTPIRVARKCRREPICGQVSMYEIDAVEGADND